MENWYQGNFDPGVIADYCWFLRKTDGCAAQAQKQASKNSFEHADPWCVFRIKTIFVKNNYNSNVITVKIPVIASIYYTDIQNCQNVSDNKNLTRKLN